MLPGNRRFSCCCCLQAPLQLKLTAATISSNAVSSGLFWLRLVNSSFTDVTIADNAGTGSHAGAEPHESAEAAVAAAMVAGGQPVQPPSPCDPGALHRALIQVHGPAAFDMNR